MTYYDKKQRRKGMNHILGSHTHSLEVNRMAHVLKPDYGDANITIINGQAIGRYFFVPEKGQRSKFEDGEVITTSPIEEMSFDTNGSWRPIRIRTKNTVYDIQYYN